MECPICECEMEQQTAVDDSWDYSSDRHITRETNFYVCLNPDCKYEYEETGENDGT